MDQKALSMFAHLSQSLHFGKTAQAHHISPSTLSRAIKRLEEEVGSELLHRDNRTVVLTDAGKKFKVYAEQQLDQWHNFRQSLAHKQVELTGKLHIYCSVTAAYSHLPPLLERFRARHPLVEIMLTTGDAADALEQVQNQAVDFAIAAAPEQLPRSVYFHHLDTIAMAVIAPTMTCKVQQQLSEKVLTWSEIPIILPEHGAARKRFELWYRKKQQGKPMIYATVSGHEALVSMVALGCGVGIVPQVVVDNSPVKDRVSNLANIGEIEPFELGVCCLNQSKAQPLIKAFFNSIT
ncbi:HTH-type transcriptional activator IlvY [Colwellia psychrerythraea]|uniref:Transcriptional regulator, LysR family n=1 Tax=Colwellia psychrerythraea TaxID=28229 RepID=A0A099KKR2_COLPS|nr:HTH-type transcriptional activator IlvY [Colwellia psychrerythraea]KGJ90865.1 transcriptional regulator, LysR family [Colwellia psychrerythraea]